jgi:hypothetical protein
MLLSLINNIKKLWRCTWLQMAQHWLFVWKYVSCLKAESEYTKNNNLMSSLFLLKSESYRHLTYITNNTEILGAFERYQPWVSLTAIQWCTYSACLTWYMSGSFSWCSTRLQRATELRSSVHSVSSGSRFTLLQNGCIDFPLKHETDMHCVFNMGR